MKSVETSRSRHLLFISLTFVLWKLLLGVLAYSSPGIGYDTSSSLLEDFENYPELIEVPPILQYSVTKLVRWDAIYFAQIAARQYVFEQEWAFSYAFSKIVSTVSQGVCTVFRTRNSAYSCSPNKLYRCQRSARHCVVRGTCLAPSTPQFGLCLVLSNQEDT